MLVLTKQESFHIIRDSNQLPADPCTAKGDNSATTFTKIFENKDRFINNFERLLTQETDLQKMQVTIPTNQFILINQTESVIHNEQIPQT